MVPQTNASLRQNLLPRPIGIEALAIRQIKQEAQLL
jgi:hypothetical protein